MISPYMTVDLYDKTKVYFLIYFSLDAIFKIITEGLILDKNSYLRQPWNLFDFFVLIIGYLELFLTGIYIYIVIHFHILILLIY